MVDDVQAARPHIIDKREVDTKRATRRDVCVSMICTCLIIILYNGLISPSYIHYRVQVETMPIKLLKRFLLVA